MRILLIEDNEDDIRLIQEHLGDEEQADFNLESSESLSAGLDRLAKEKFDVVLLDLVLPDSQGLDTFRKTKEQAPDVPIIVLTGLDDEELAVRTLREGAQDYLVKGKYDNSVLVRAMRYTIERKRAEQALRESEMRFRQLYDEAPVGYHELNTEGHIIRVNRTELLMLDYTAEEMLGTPVWEFIVEKETSRNSIMAKLAGTQPPGVGFERTFRQKNGTKIQMMLEERLLQDESGRITGMRATLHDITDRKGAEDKIRQQAALLDIATDAIVVRDLEGHILFWNKGAEKLYGWSREEAVEKKGAALLNQENSHQFEEARKILVEKDEWKGELHQLTKDGKEIIVDSRCTLMRDDQRKPTSILFVNTDITDKKKFEANFLRVQRMESLGTLAGGIAHDLNNVLAPILLSIEILKHEHVGDKNQQMLATLESNAKRGGDIVKQVLTFARGAEGERVVLQLKYLIREMEQIAKETFPKSIEICTDIPKDVWTIWGDATQLHQVLMNLCLNARDAMPKGGKLTIAADNVNVDEHYARMNLEAKAGPYVVVSVSDTGIGISPGVVGKIFEPFFTTKGVGKGTGLGLATVSALVKGHNGFVNVYSDVGKGTTFKVYLPATSIPETPLVEEERAELPRGQGELILVVDDEASIRDITKDTMEMYGYRVTTANDGTEAVALYAEKKGEISIVLTDMVMPYMDGVATIRALQKLDPQVKIVAMSGVASESRIGEASAAGVRTFLRKPYTAEKMLKALNEILSPKQ